MNHKDTLASRRGFLKGATGTVIAAAALTPGVAMGQSKGSPTARIVQIEHKGATTGKTSLDDAVVVTMIKEALKAYARTDTAVKALRKYFDPKQKIAIKVNTLGSPYSSVNPITAFTLADLLHEMGAPKSNIRIFDQYQTRMRKGRFKLRKPDADYWVTKHIGRDPKQYKYEHKYPDGKTLEIDFHYDQLIVWADAVLNVCIPKDHDLTGVTGALKNMAMGTMQPTAERAGNKANPGHYTVVPRFHKNNCDPAIGWLYSRPMIKDKVKLIVADALRVLYHGGPQDKPQWRQLYNQIWVAEDPVAVDRTIHTLINGLRKKHGMKPVEEDLFRGEPRLATYLDSAAKMGLGVGDPAKITLEKKVLA